MTPLDFKAFNKLKKNTKYIEAKKKLVQAIALKDMATAKIKKIHSTLKTVGKFVAKPLIAAKDKTTAVIGKIKGIIKGLAKGIAIPISIATAGIGAAAKSGMDLDKFFLLYRIVFLYSVILTLNNKLSKTT